MALHQRECKDSADASNCSFYEGGFRPQLENKYYRKEKRKDAFDLNKQNLVNKVKVITAKTINEATGISAHWVLGFANASKAPCY